MQAYLIMCLLSDGELINILRVVSQQKFTLINLNCLKYQNWLWNFLISTIILSRCSRTAWPLSRRKQHSITHSRSILLSNVIHYLHHKGHGAGSWKKRVSFAHNFHWGLQVIKSYLTSKPVKVRSHATFAFLSTLKFNTMSMVTLWAIYIHSLELISCELTNLNQV